MEFKLTVKEVENREDYYDLHFSTYKEKIEGRFERSEIRYLIEQLDNSINVGS